MTNRSEPRGAREPLPCVVYAAKSTEDSRGSLRTQVSDCRRAILEGRDGRVRRIASEFSDEGKSAYRGNRGAGLEAAKRASVEAAELAGGAELWVQHSDRLARGDGLQADHLAEVYFAMRRRHVRLRSVQDDSNLEDVIRVTLIGERNSEDSRRKSEAVLAGKDRQIERGERLGGPVVDGYRRVITVEEGAVAVRYELDGERAPVLRRAFELAGRGMGDPSIARALNREGHRTKAGGYFRRRRVQDLITNPYYAGRVVRYRGTPGEQAVPGTHPALIAPDEFDRVQALRRTRDRAVGSARSPERPSGRFALARLARCLRCGQTMYAKSSTYRRKDGTRARRYVCASTDACDGGCDQPPLDAAVIDQAILGNLEGLLLDFERWVGELTDSRDEQHQRIEMSLAEAECTSEKLRRRETLLRERWMQAIEQGDERRENAAFDALDTIRDQRTTSHARLQELADELTIHTSQPDAGPARESHADFLDALGTYAAKGAIADVNAALRELFSAIWLDRTRRGLTVHPQTRPDLSAVFAFNPTALSGRLLDLTNDHSDPIAALTSYARPEIPTLIPEIGDAATPQTARARLHRSQAGHGDLGAPSST